MLLMHNPGPSLLGSTVVLTGLPVRWLLVRRRVMIPVVARETQVP